METAPTMDQDISNIGPRPSLVDICHSLFGKHPKMSYVACKLCKSGIKIVPDGQSSLLIDPVIDHACIHADLKTFQCRRCEHSSRTRSDVRAHIEGFHCMKPIDTDFEDHSEKFHDEISNSIKRCFTKCNGEAPTNNEAPKKDEDPKNDEAPTKAEGRGHGSNKEVRNTTRVAHSHRQSKLDDAFFKRIIKNGVDSDGKIKCRLCSKKIKATRSLADGGFVKTEYALKHAEYHLRKPLYQCGVCKERLNTYGATQDHLHRKHALGLKKNFKCFADEFHSDVLEIFAQCYEKKLS